MKRLWLVLLMGLSGAVSAAYDANMKGVITDLMVYTYEDTIIIKLNNQPTSHPACNPSHFAIDATVPLDRRQAILSRLLTAYASKENVNIGYDSQGNCAGGFIRMYRAG